MHVEQLVGWGFTGETEVPEEKPASVAFFDQKFHLT
jgi:hypothetical protein